MRLRAEPSILSAHRMAAALQPDLLGQLFPPDRLFQLDQVHLHTLTAVAGGRLRLMILAQNVRDTAGWLQVWLAPLAGCGRLAGRLPALRIEIGPAALLMARLDIPLRKADGATPLRLLLKGSAVIGGGRTIRPQRRTPVHRRVRPPFAPRFGIWPRRPSLRHWFMHRRPVIEVELPALASHDVLDPLYHRVTWQVGELWIPDESVDLDELTRQVSAAMGP
jgi:hypothetical protein